jgi:hypothetical protein
MQYTDKQLLYQSFLSRWEKGFRNARFIVAYLNHSPELVEKLTEPILSADSLEESQLEWISLIAQLEDPLDTSFFKDYWVPITRGSYEDFIDISSPNFTIFTIHYFSLEPYGWYTGTIIQDISRFLLSADDQSIDIDQELILNRSDRWDQFYRLFAKWQLLGLQGKLEPAPVDLYSLFDSHSSYSQEDQQLVIDGVSSLVIGLLPYETEIGLDCYCYKPRDGEGEENPCIIGSIKALVFFIQENGSRNVDSYQAHLTTNETCQIKYEYGVFTLLDPERLLLDGVVEKLKAIWTTRTPL